MWHSLMHIDARTISTFCLLSDIFFLIWYFLVLGMIMGSFIACWFPFFFLYSISPVCPVCEANPDRWENSEQDYAFYSWSFCSPCCVWSWGFSVAFWLGYSNSAFNPVSESNRYIFLILLFLFQVIYTVFNNNFRRLFKKILFKYVALFS